MNVRTSCRGITVEQCSQSLPKAHEMTVWLTLFTSIHLFSWRTDLDLVDPQKWPRERTGFPEISSNTVLPPFLLLNLIDKLIRSWWVDQTTLLPPFTPRIFWSTVGPTRYSHPIGQKQKTIASFSKSSNRNHNKPKQTKTAGRQRAILRKTRFPRMATKMPLQYPVKELTKFSPPMQMITNE